MDQDEEAARHPGTHVLRLLVRQQGMIQQLLQRYRAARCAQALGEQDAIHMTGTFCAAIAVHLHLQEEILYPAARELLRGETRLLDALAAEHAALKSLLAELGEASPSDLLSGVRLAVLSDRLDRLFEHQQQQLFPRLDERGLDLSGLGRLLLNRQEQLLAEKPTPRAATRDSHRHLH